VLTVRPILRQHWFAIDIWHYFQDYGKDAGCEYQYIMRFDEDSFVHSPIRYDVFEFMRSNDYSYGFRLCAYEMQVTQRIWKLWRSSPGSPSPIRDIDLEMCGIYNNFFVAKVSFFQGKEVQRFLRFVDRQGLIYRRRLGDLMIHSMVVYAFAPPEAIHRFLDFTYQHATLDDKTKCVVWGGIQAGYDDPDAATNIATFLQENMIARNCNFNVTMMRADDLSPTYAHLTDRLARHVSLESVMVGKVELPNKGILSG
jgi:Glycolipid 2-alpha-mannosyltransferase